MTGFLIFLAAFAWAGWIGSLRDRWQAMAATEEALDAGERLAEQLKKVKAQNLALADRVHKLEMPPSVEDPLSPTWCRECECGTYGWAPEMGVWVDGHHPNCSKVGGLFPSLTAKEKAAIANGPDGRILAAAEKDTGVSLIQLFHCEKCETVYEDVEACPIHGAAVREGD